jgi:hypothetical protein
MPRKMNVGALSICVDDRPASNPSGIGVSSYFPLVQLVAAWNQRTGPLRARPTSWVRTAAARAATDRAHSTRSFALAVRSTAIACSRACPGRRAALDSRCWSARTRGATFSDRAWTARECDERGGVADVPGIRESAVRGKPRKRIKFSIVRREPDFSRPSPDFTILPRCRYEAPVSGGISTVPDFRASTSKCGASYSGVSPTIRAPPEL